MKNPGPWVIQVLNPLSVRSGALASSRRHVVTEDRNRAHGPPLIALSPATLELGQSCRAQRGQHGCLRVRMISI